MNRSSILFAALVTLASTARAEDLGYRLSPTSHRCEKQGVAGLNPHFLGECGDLRGAALGAAHLEDANLDGIHLEGADLRGAHFEGAFLAGAVFDGARLGGASFVAAHLTGASFQRAELSRASFRGSFLWKASLRGADVRGALLDEFPLGLRVETCDFRDVQVDATTVVASRLEETVGASRTQVVAATAPISRR